MLAQNPASLPLLTIVPKVFNQFVFHFHNQIIDEIELVPFGLRVKVVVSEFHLLWDAHIELNFESCSQVVLVTAAFLEQIDEYHVFIVGY